MRQARSLAVLLCSLALTCGGCASHGREVFRSAGCVSCHRFRDDGGSLGPDLTDVASRREAAAIREKIRRPQVDGSAARMPAFEHLDWFDLHSLVAYLRS